MNTQEIETKRYSVCFSNGDAFEDADSLEEAMEIARDAAQEDVDDGNDASFSDAILLYEIYDNEAECLVWTGKEGWLQ